MRVCLFNVPDSVPAALRNRAFWDKKLAEGLPSGASEDWDRRVGRAADAWDAQIRREEAAAGGQGKNNSGGGGMVRGRDAVQGTQQQQQQQQAQAHPRHEFEQNLLKQAQGLWSMLQGKGGEVPL